jgi:protein-glutamine gamma-glutamyltransferase
MRIGLPKTLETALLDGRISAADATLIEQAVHADGRVSGRERTRLKKLLKDDLSKMDSGVEARMRALIGVPAPPGTASTETVRLLDAASAGGLDGNELKAAQAQIAAKFGADAARTALRAALADRAGALTLDGARWVQQAHGSYQGNIGRLQTVLESHLKGAVLLDLNFNDKLDAGDVAVSAGASAVNVKAIEQAFADEVRVGAAMVAACEAMGRARHDFELINDHRANPDFFTTSAGTFTLKPAKSAAAAVDDIFKSPSKYGFECATALVIVYYKAMLELLGPKDFDRICSDLRIGPWDQEDHLARSLVRDGSSTSEATAARRATLRVGEYGYFRNWDVSPKGREEGWQGENVIYLGGDRFYGHPFGVSTEKHIVDELGTFRNPGSTRAASFLDLRRKLSPAILVEDQQRG